MLSFYFQKEELLAYGAQINTDMVYSLGDSSPLCSMYTSKE